MVDDPWVHVVKLVLASNTRTGRHNDGLIRNNVNDVLDGKEIIQ